MNLVDYNGIANLIINNCLNYIYNLYLKVLFLSYRLISAINVVVSQFVSTIKSSPIAILVIALRSLPAHIKQSPVE